jgi:DNA-binding NarL/FixJ family response regulator
MVRVVLIDDSDAVRSTLRRGLDARHGIEIVAEAGDGAGAIEVVAKELPDVVVVDCAMPGMDGAETTRSIVSSHPGIRIVGFSADPSNEQRMRDTGAVAFVLKPAPVSDLAGAILGVGSGDEKGTGEPR